MKTSIAAVEMHDRHRALANRVVAQLGADPLLADRLGPQRGGQAAGVEHADQEVDFSSVKSPVIWPLSADRAVDRAGPRASRCRA